ncbi:MAG: cell division protein SepF [Lachnospiraceae bacterium]
MGFLDKILNAVKLNDDYDDDDDFFDDDDAEEVEKPKKRFFKKLDNDDDFDDNEPAKTPVRAVKPAKETAAAKTTAPKTAAKPKTVSKPKTSSKITPLSGRTSVANMEVCVIKPNSMEDTREIADTLLDDCTVLLNLEGIDVEVAQRVIDFSSGTCYALGGSLQKVSSYIFVLTPANVEISGDFQEILNNNFNMPSFRTEF